ncbi:MAG: hypothetical protein IRZ13_21490, partial [Acetobacteraceae bacterium]|nr:hypothetical protein [Acetobacteraceae bacterium]
MHRLQRAPKASAVHTMFCTHAEVQVDGRPEALPSADALAGLLACQRDARLQVTLKNAAEPGAEPETSTYDITIRAPDAADLVLVEEAFARHFVEDGRPLSSSRVTTFLAASAAASTACDYADALAAYANGVLAKDQAPGTTIMLSWAEHEEKFKRALPVLSGIERPLARLVAGLIRFALNDFPHDPAPSGFARLDAVAHRLASMVGRSWKFPSPGASGRTRRACPTDTGTDAVLAEAERLARLPRWGAPASDMLHGQLAALARFPLDRAKLAALGAEAALRLLAALRGRLMDPEIFRAFVAEFTAEWNRLQAKAAAGLAARRQELERVGRQIGRLVDAIAEGAPAASLRERLAALERRKGELEAELAVCDAPAPRLHPNLAEVYRRRVAELTAALAAEDAAEVRERVRGLVEEIRLVPEDGRLRIEVRGALGAILRLAEEGARNRQRPGEVVAGAVVGQIKLGAGAGFEPAAFRL